METGVRSNKMTDITGSRVQAIINRDRITGFCHFLLCPVVDHITSMATSLNFRQKKTYLCPSTIINHYEDV